MKKFKFIKGERFTVFSGWHECHVTYEPVFFVDGEGKKQFLFSPPVSGEITSNGKMNWQLSSSIEDGEKRLESFKKQIMKNNGKWIDAYSTWPYHPKETLGKGPIEFIAWVKEKKYSFVQEITDICIEDDIAIFSGNLNEYSHAFRFQIYDKELAKKVIKESGVTVKDYNNS